MSDVQDFVDVNPWLNRMCIVVRNCADSESATFQAVAQGTFPFAYGVDVYKEPAELATELSITEAEVIGIINAIGRDVAASETLTAEIVAATSTTGEIIGHHADGSSFTIQSPTAARMKRLYETP